MLPSREAVRVAIAGAASLRGKDLKQWIEEIGFPASEIRLVDEDLVAGTLTEAAGEPVLIETVSEESFARARFVFFTGSPAFSLRHGEQARRAGATVIDLSGGLASAPGARFWIPALDASLAPAAAGDVSGKPQSLFLAPLAPADVAISLSAAFAPLGLERLVLTIFQPVSERGRQGIEELEAQVLKLMAFQPIDQSVYDVQVGFTMLSRYGSGSTEKLSDSRMAIVQAVRAYLEGRTILPAISLVQAPVFYSHAFTAFAEFAKGPDLDEMAERAQAAGLKVIAEDDAAPNNISVVEEPRPVIGRPSRDPANEHGVWIWGAADNLRVPVATAVAIAEKLLAS